VLTVNIVEGLEINRPFSSPVLASATSNKNHQVSPLLVLHPEEVGVAACSSSSCWCGTIEESPRTNSGIYILVPELSATEKDHPYNSFARARKISIGRVH